ncbi:hypothetical protein B4U79_19062 [Dinothrombium tinctorium]|uniref:NTR domain-containing protein n=1 Tax=Dinothrombium tinctorium TaxID=1965070 RepID=A0A3S4QR33_9ACAR|nr:hypothetical protein B4U79_19062 [Dinothrombium tinctorium]
MHKLFLTLILLDFSVSIFCCQCLFGTPLQHFCLANTVVKLNVKSEKTYGNAREYDVEILETLKSNSRSLPQKMKLLTSYGTGLCGLELEKGVTYLLTSLLLTPINKKAQPVLVSSSCSYHLNLDKATEKQKKAALGPFIPELNCDQPAAKIPDLTVSN